MRIPTVRKLAIAVALAGTFATANATTTALGPVAVDVPLPFSGTVMPAGTFNDIFTFILPANGGSGYSVLNFPLDIPGVGTFNTVLNTMSLVSNPDGVLFNGDDVAVKSVVSAGASSLSLTFGPTTGGNMYLNVTGITNGTLGGLYNGAISVSAVPEPEVWATMLVGAGLVGFQLRRKAKRIAEQRFV